MSDVTILRTRSQAALVSGPAGMLPPRQHFPNALPPPARPERRSPMRMAPEPLDAETLVYRLEEAGTTLLSLPNAGHSTRLRTSNFDVLAAAIDGTSWASPEPGRIRPPPPDSARIDRMDEAFGWLSLIPQDRYVLRRIVGARALVSPSTERHVFSWRRLGAAIGADHKAVQRWHAQGIAMIAAALRSA